MPHNELVTRCFDWKLVPVQELKKNTYAIVVAGARLPVFRARRGKQFRDRARENLFENFCKHHCGEGAKIGTNCVLEKE